MRETSDSPPSTINFRGKLSVFIILIAGKKSTFIKAMVIISRCRKNSLTRAFGADYSEIIPKFIALYECWLNLYAMFNRVRTRSISKALYIIRVFIHDRVSFRSLYFLPFEAEIKLAAMALMQKLLN